MKLISWNVNGLRACVQKGFLDYFRAADADFFCIQESKLQEGQITLDLPALLFLPKKNHLTSHAASEPPSVIPKAG